MPRSEVGALTFDVFGTVVDWRTSVIREVETMARAAGVELDAARFADDWRGGYGSGMRRVRAGELPWANVDALHRLKLDELLAGAGVTGLTEAETDHLNRAWHRLEPWPDTVEGLTRLKDRYVIATLSNGNVSLLTNMAKYGRLPWDCVLSSELTGSYKPDPEVYRTAAKLLDLPPERVLMVAAHVSDLRGAQSAGLRTALVRRPLEFGPEGDPDLEPDPSFDVVADDFVHLAEQLGA